MEGQEPENGEAAKPTPMAVVFKVKGVKGGRLKTVEGKLTTTCLEGIKDSFRLVAYRDSRIQEMEIRDERGTLLWCLIPATIRSALDQGGLSADVIQGLPPGFPKPGARP